MTGSLLVMCVDSNKPLHINLLYSYYPILTSQPFRLSRLTSLIRLSCAVQLVPSLLIMRNCWDTDGRSISFQIIINFFFETRHII